MDAAKLRKLHEERAAAWREMNSILDGAKEESRDLTAAEASKYDRAEARFDELSEKIAAEGGARSVVHALASGGLRSVGSDGIERMDGDRGEALRAIEARSEVLSSTAGDRLTDLVERDVQGADARYITAVSDPAYKRAFFRSVFAPAGARAQLAPDEAAAMERVGRVMEERSLLAGVQAQGGFAVPFELDPTLLLTSDGAVNPIRELATVTTIGVTTWQGVTTEGVDAAFVPEATEATDDAPTLARPQSRRSGPRHGSRSRLRWDRIGRVSVTRCSACSRMRRTPWRRTSSLTEQATMSRRG